MNERALAIQVLTEITTAGGYNNIALRKAFDKNPGMSKSQRGFVTEVVNGTLRKLYHVDYYIDAVSVMPSATLKPFILNDLRVAVYQLLFLSGAPEYAVCSQAVELAKKNGFSELSGFVHGVLRNLLRQKDEIKLPDSKLDPSKFLSVSFSYPIWIIERFLRQFGYDKTLAMLELNATAPKVGIYRNKLKCSASELSEAMTKEKIELKAFEPEGAYELGSSSDITKIAPFQKGWFHVIDKSSVIAAKAMKPAPGSVVIDLCAAPGGKSYVLAELMENKGRILAFDVHKHKIGLIKEGADRLGLSIIEPMLGDGTVINEKLIETADYVLVDAPCSGLGLVRKKPDIKYTKTEDDIKNLAALQRRLLTVALKYLKPGGILLYCSCTLTDEENYNNAGWFAKQEGVERVNLADFADEMGIGSCAQYGYISLLPQDIGSDGFFISKFTKRAGR